jgi:hypothetical protein
LRICRKSSRPSMTNIQSWNTWLSHVGIGTARF